jgi:ribose 5-phosphate isomerase A
MFGVYMKQKKLAGEKAAEYIKDGMILGLGTGSTA